MHGSKRDDRDPRNRLLCSGPTGCHEKARFEAQRDKKRAMEQTGTGNS